MKRMLYLGALTFILATTGWLVFRHYAAGSEAFLYVSDRIKHSEIIKQRIGPIEEVRIPFVGHYSAHYSTRLSRVDVTAEAVGTRGTVKIDVEITKDDRGFKLTESSIDGTPVDL